jgi:histidinol-phosphate/aromatic aminotransferase/cobyric acid decarboxylase-like protein
MKVKISDFRCPINPVGPSAKGKNLVRKTLRHLGDCSNDGLLHLRNYLAMKEGVAAQNILFGHDRDHCMRVLLKTLAPASVMVLWPLSWRLRLFFSESAISVREIMPATSGVLEVDVDTLLKGATEADVVLISRPHEMTGVVLADSDLAVLVEFMEKHGKKLIIDDSYREFTLCGPLYSSVANASCCAVIKSLSPFYTLSMFRLGYVYGSREIMAALSPVMMDDHVSPLACWAALASLKDRGFARRTKQFYAQEKTFMVKSVARIPGVSAFDNGSDSILVVLPAGKASVPEKLYAMGMLLDHFPDREGRTYLRFPVGKHPVNARLVRTFKRIVEGFHGT